jgi:YidC/Oxa1 family membrane protein insertase
MDRRTLLAVVLCVAVLYIVQALFPAPRARPGSRADSLAAVARAESAAAKTHTPAGPTESTVSPTASAPASNANAGPVPAETVTVTMPSAEVAFSTVGAAPVNATMREYRATVNNVADRQRAPLVQVGLPGQALLRYRVITPHDTLPLDRVAFRHTVTHADSAPVVAFQGDVSGQHGAVHVTLIYAFGRDGYLAKVSGSVDGLSGDAGQSPGYLLIDLPTSFPSYEADTADDVRQLAYSYAPLHEDASSVSFSRLQPGQAELRSGPLVWAAAKNKYFLVGLLSADTLRAHQFAELELRGAPRVEKEAKSAAATAVLPLWTAPAAAPAGRAANFAFSLYAGPQDYRRLRAIGRGFENLNPYGGFFHVILQPFVTLVILSILGLHQLLHVNYAWILVIFGVVTRIVLWPLNQRAMRTSFKMQRLQPELQEAQTKYKHDPQRFQQETMKIYQAHGMSPWSPIMGCLPMLLPWPIFAALYFVFRTTIEFRGVPFLWMHDISVKDPYYIMPILMGVTYLLVSWVGMRNVPPNPQTKMMAYVMPAMMTVFFLRIAAGLNLYYFVQSLATIPQQWYISNERAKASGASAPARSAAVPQGRQARTPGRA